MNARKLPLLLGLLIAGTGNAFAGAHTITYARKSVALGTVVPMVNGDEYVVIRIPFVTFEGTRYSIILPAPADFAYVYVVTSHDTSAFTSNITVDTLPARISVDDSRSYTVSGLIGTAATFSVQAAATATLQIKVGASTIVSISETVVRKDSVTHEDEETHVDGLATYDFRPNAEWAQYKDLTTEVKVLNDLLDYVRIVAQ